MLSHAHESKKKSEVRQLPQHCGKQAGKKTHTCGHIITCSYGIAGNRRNVGANTFPRLSKSEDKPRSQYWELGILCNVMELQVSHGVTERHPNKYQHRRLVRASLWLIIHTYDIVLYLNFFGRVFENKPLLRVIFRTFPRMQWYNMAPGALQTPQWMSLAAVPGSQENYLSEFHSDSANAPRHVIPLLARALY